MVKTIFILFILLAVGWTGDVSSHILVDVYSLLEVEEPSLLPDSPFYFFKSMKRGVKLFFAFDAAKKAELELKFLDEKLAETYKLFDTTADLASLELAFRNYLDSHQRLLARLESLKGKNKNVDRLLEKLAARVIDHQKLFDELEEKLGEKVNEAQEKFAKEIKNAFELNREKFKEKLKEKIRKDRSDDLEDLRTLEEFKGISDALEETLGDLEEELIGKNLKDPEEDLEELEKIEQEIREKEKKPGERPTDCIQLYDPVCGIDGKTYPNECFAGVAGVAIKHGGECAVGQKQSAPLLQSLNRSSGPVGTAVTAKGTGFSAKENTVKFGVGYIKSLASNDGRTLEFIVPEGHDLCAPSLDGPCAQAYPRVEPGKYEVSIMNVYGESNILIFTVIK